MNLATRQSSSHHRNRPGRRSRAARLVAAVEPLEGRLLLTAVVVNTTADVTHAAGSTVVSMRDAVNIANKSTTPTTITFSPTAFAAAKTITLNGNALELSGKHPLTITGPAARVTVSGNHASVDFIIDPGAAATITGLTITGGTNTTSSNGGGIENNGTLTLTGVHVTGNSGGNGEGDGGGIYNSGKLVITNSTVSNNNSGGFFGNGGGIDNTGTLVLTNSTVSNNNLSGGSPGEGGGIDNETGGTLTLTKGTVSGNQGANSGGIENHGTATLTSVTVSDNQSVGFAGPGGQGPGVDGGIGNYGTMTLTDCTVSGNSNGDTGGGIGNHGTLTLADSTISGNTTGGGTFYSSNYATTAAAGKGGGLYVDPSSTSTVIQNTIIAANQVIDGTGPDVFGAVHSLGYNLIGQTNGSTGWKSTDRTGTTAKPLDALLSPLANFYGPTLTMVPLVGSPAIDHGSNALVPAGTATDQRGLPRIRNGTVDIGAVEVQPANAHIVVTTRTGLTAVEGKPASIVPGSFTDTGGSGPFLAEANWGDGSAVGLYPVGAAGALPAATHTFAKAGTYHGTVTVIDATGHLSTATPLTVRVADAPLSGSASPRSGVAAGAPFADHVAAFTDADPNGTVTDYSAKINWGDGTTSVGVVASTTLGATTGPFGVTGTHTYAKAGTYKFSVTVADFGGSTLTVSSTVTCVNAKSIVVNTITASWSSPA